MTLSPEQIQAYRNKYKIGDSTAPATDQTTQAAPMPSPEERIAKLKASTTQMPQDTGGGSQEMPAPEEKSGLAKVGGFIKDVAKDAAKTLVVKPVARATEAIGRTGIFGQNIKKGYEEMADNGESQNLNTALGNYDIESVKGGLAGAKQVVGEGLKSASYLYGAGGAKKAGSELVNQTFKQSLKTGAKTGTASGAAYGAGDALEQDKGAGDVIKDTAIGAVTGLATGVALPAIGGVASKTVKGFANRAERKATEKALLGSDNIPNSRIATPDSRIATKALDEAGKVVDDPVAKEAVRQGIPEADVAFIKTSNPEVQTAMRRMTEIREKGITDKVYGATNRSTDVVGDSVMEHANFLEKTNKEAGQELNTVAQKLNGKNIDSTKALTQFETDLVENAGIKIGKDGKLNFKGSDFEGLNAVQKSINDAWGRAMRAAKSGDALALHRVKSYIDQMVEYGAGGEGLKGKASAILKKFRHNIDETLDKRFPTYNKVNTRFADTIKELEKIHNALGSKFKLSDINAHKKLGASMRSILSNGSGRASILQLIDGMTGTTKKYGLQTKNDPIRLALYADTLEKIFGSEASTSLLGNMEKAGKAVSAGVEMTKDGVIPTVIKGGKFLADMARGVNSEAKMKALKELIRGNSKPTSNFGKKITR